MAGASTGAEGDHVTDASRDMAKRPMIGGSSDVLQQRRAGNWWDGLGAAESDSGREAQGADVLENLVRVSFPQILGCDVVLGNSFAFVCQQKQISFSFF